VVKITKLIGEIVNGSCVYSSNETEEINLYMQVG